jgi:hypothetical protein
MDESRPQKKPHVSPSQLDMYFRCGEQYRRRYVLGEIVPPGVALVKGSAVHKAAEINYRQKVESHVDLALSDLTEAAAADVTQRVAAEGLMLTPEESSAGLSAVRGEIVDRAVSLVGVFHSQVAPQVQPALVEKFVTIDLPSCSHNLLGRLDVTDADDLIRDLKTASRRKVQAEVDRSDQLTFYYAAFARLTGRRAAGVAMDVLLDQKKPGLQQLRSERTEKDRDVFVARLNAMLHGIKAGAFAPAPLGSWCC